MGGLGLCGEVTGRKSGLVGGDEARKMGEGGAREKGETMGELRGEDAVLSSALAKMKAVSVRLRWYRLNGLPGEGKKKKKTVCEDNKLPSLQPNAVVLFQWVYVPVREDPGLVGLCDDDDDSCLKNSRGFMER